VLLSIRCTWGETGLSQNELSLLEMRLLLEALDLVPPDISLVVNLCLLGQEKDGAICLLSIGTHE
jgi:hypothetical protein